MTLSWQLKLGQNILDLYYMMKNESNFQKQKIHYSITFQDSIFD
ncbi:unnamed protein product [Paramecium octaurelia]|uniref:Uncharacterized protein n=1 Tax=Paramecium octaurelia TaxID=43137 RepID=A0A8S1YLY9_PAROT|nr:unnamed protein product [Paramecium octaurelia]CAD8214766.1 unnamed protein product [Paramecium octaurelia]